MTLQLRDYQQTDLDRLRAEFRTGARAVLYVAPTGSGKTVLFSTVVSNAKLKGSRIWVVVPRPHLVEQCSATLTDLGVLHGVVSGARYFHPGCQVLVCSVQTLVRRVAAGKIEDADLIVIDEAHHVVAGTWREIIEAQPRARLLGVTATPLRLDGKGLGVEAGGVFDRMVVGPSVKELTDLGWLSPYTLYRPPTMVDLTGVKRSMGDYAKGQLAAAVDRPHITGDAVEQYAKHCPGEPALVFCASVDHATHVATQFREAGWRSESIDGNTPGSVRQERIKALGEGRMHVLTSCEVISEGTDIPTVSAAILLRPTQSLGLYLQQVGRCLRPAPGKRRAVILDHVGNYERHMLPDTEREWTLDGLNNGAPKEKVEKPRTCRACFAAFDPAPRCPYCGVEYVVQAHEIEQVTGELVEVTEEERQELAVKRDKKARIKRAKTVEELDALADEFGYKPGWAEHQLRVRGEYKARYARRG